MKQQFLVGVAGTIRLTVYDKNRPLIPTSATVTLYKAGTTEVLQSSAAATINSTTGEITYILTTTHTAIKGLNYKAAWTYVVNGTTYYETQLFDVVRSVLSIPITDDDLYRELPSLAKKNVQESGTATAGAASSLTDTTKRKETDDYWKGGTLEIVSGTGAGQSRMITSNVQSTGVISITPDWVTTPDTTSKYRIVRSWYSVIEHCFDKFEQMLYDKGNRAALILETSQTRVPIIFLTLLTIALDLRDEEGDKWDLIFKDYDTKFKEAFTNLKLDYDADESGAIDVSEKQETVNDLRIFRS